MTEPPVDRADVVARATLAAEKMKANDAVGDRLLTFMMTTAWPTLIGQRQ